jgi:hypothetical protein
MNMRHKDSSDLGDTHLGWVVRCTIGCEGVVHRDPPTVGDCCPLCGDGQQKSGSITESIKIMPAAKQSEQMSLEGGISFEGDEFQPWNVDLGSFLKSDTADSSDITHVGGIEALPLLANIGVDPIEVVPDENLLTNHQNGKIKSQGQSSSADQNHVTAENNASAELFDDSDGVRFTQWHVIGLVCCVLLLFVGGLLTFDIVRYLYSPNNTIITSPILRFLR